MIHIINNLPEKYVIILDGLKNYLTSSGDDTVAKVVIREKLNHIYVKIKNKNEEKKKEKRPWLPLGHSIKADAVSMVSNGNSTDPKCPKN